MNRAARSPCALALAALVWFCGCLYDAGDRCSPNQRLDSRGYCVCIAGAVFDQQTLACKLIPDAGTAGMGAGTACVSSADCTDPKFPVCRTSKGGAYCTKGGCTTDADCPATYRCDESAVPAVCRRPATAAGRTCTTTADCSGVDASFCATEGLNQCVPEDCSLTASGACDRGWTCCDVGTARVGFVKTLCLPVAACP